VRRGFSFRDLPLNFCAGNDIILDFSRLHNLDSAGIGEVVSVHMEARAESRAVCLVAPTPRVRSLLELANVASLFEIHPTVEAAFTILKTRAA
jgi:anti-anti-sigma factor